MADLTLEVALSHKAPHQTGHSRLEKKTQKFDEAKHPREPGGSSEGGQFTETGHAGEATSHPALARQAQEGIAAVEKLIPEAVRTSDLSDVPGDWQDLSESTREKVRQAHHKKVSEEYRNRIDAEGFDAALTEEIGREQDVHKEKFVEAATQQLLKDFSLDPATIRVDPGQNRVGAPILRLAELRHPDGTTLSVQEEQDVQDTMDVKYTSARDKAVDAYLNTAEFADRQKKLAQQKADQNWRSLDDQAKYNLGLGMQAWGLLPADTLQLRREPKQWVTGVASDDDSGSNYARTHAIALRLTELRTDELRKERGLLGTGEVPKYTIERREIEAVSGKTVLYEGKDQFGHVISSAYTLQGATNSADAWASNQSTEASRLDTKEIINGVWESWKRKSSEGRGLSLQLASALEFDGFHRMSPEEVREAEHFAEAVGGIDTLRAYVRAQWEVTQTIMAKAGENKVDVYRAIMLPGEMVAKTPKEHTKNGQPLDPPSNIKTEREHDEHDRVIREWVSFDYNGEHFRVEKVRKFPGAWPDVSEDIKKKVRDEWGARGAHINAAEVEKYKKEFDNYPDYNKLAIMRDMVQSRRLPKPPFEEDEEAVRHRVTAYRFGLGEDILTKLPDLKLMRAGAQSTTGTEKVANEWQGVGEVPSDAVRVVIRIEAPPTSVLSLPVYGKNIQEEHESVLMGTRDKWLWDAWLGAAPRFDKQPIVHPARKAETQTIVIDLQAEDRGKPHWMSTVNWSALQSVAKFDEAKHPREAAGTSEGGQFTESGHAGGPTSDPVLAEQAKTGIAAVEKLLPEAVDTADYEDISAHTPESWDDVSEAVQEKVRDKWYEDAYGNSDIDTFDLDDEIRKEVQDDNQEILDQAEKETIDELTATDTNPFTDKALTLPVEGVPAFQLHKTLDPETFNYVDGDHDRHDHTVELDLEALRFTSGEPLTDDEQRIVQTRWDDNYRQAYDKALESAYESDDYQQRRSEMESQVIDEQWSGMRDSEKLSLVEQYGFQSTSVNPGRPDNWVTGVETGSFGDEDYGRSHAVALRLAELRTDELREERGLLVGEKPAFTIEKAVDHTEAHPNYVAKDAKGKIVANSSTLEQATLNAEEWSKDQSERLSRVRTDTLIRRVWTEWKSSSSESLGLSLQLATARELGGVHRMSPEEVAEAESAAESQGGMATLQAYVRAQWEVTQYVMDKAGENHIEVYRGLMLAGDRVAQTPHQFVDKMGNPPKPPTNVQQGRNPSSGNPLVNFDFNGEHFVVERKVSFDFTEDEKGAAVVESVESAMQRRIDDYLKGRQTGILTKLPELQLRRAGAQSTTGTASVANEWGGVGNLPEKPVRVVIRVDAPATSVLSLPVYGQNEQNEHETVLAGTKDRWLWDAWQNAAPNFKSQPVSRIARKGDLYASGD